MNMIFKDNYEESIKKAKAQDNKKLEAICQKLEDDILQKYKKALEDQGIHSDHLGILLPK